jgi:hypothetical protein
VKPSKATGTGFGAMAKFSMLVRMLVKTSVTALVKDEEMGRD